MCVVCECAGMRESKMEKSTHHRTNDLLCTIIYIHHSFNVTNRQRYSQECAINPFPFHTKQKKNTVLFFMSKDAGETTLYKVAPHNHNSLENTQHTRAKQEKKMWIELSKWKTYISTNANHSRMFFFFLLFVRSWHCNIVVKHTAAGVRRKYLWLWSTSHIINTRQTSNQYIMCTLLHTWTHIISSDMHIHISTHPHIHTHSTHSLWLGKITSHPWHS